MQLKRSVWRQRSGNVVQCTRFGHLLLWRPSGGDKIFIYCLFSAWSREIHRRKSKTKAEQSLRCQEVNFSYFYLSKCVALVFVLLLLPTLPYNLSLKKEQFNPKDPSSSLLFFRWWLPGLQFTSNICLCLFRKCLAAKRKDQQVYKRKTKDLQL